MSRVYKLYLPTYRARPISRAGFSLNRRQREPPDRSCHPIPPPRHSAHHPLSLLPPRPHNVPSPSPLPTARHSSRACVRAPAACLCPCVFNDSSFRFRNERSFTDGQPPCAPQGEGERMAPLSCCETDDSPNFFIPIGAVRLPRNTEISKSRQFALLP